MDGSNWRRRLKLPRPDPVDKQRRKEEKRAKEDEKRKLKEEERRQKEQQKSQRKMKKKDSKCGPLGVQGSPGWTLEELAVKEESLVPLFVEKCVAFIEEEGFTTEGLYRVPGNRVHVEMLMERFKEGQRCIATRAVMIGPFTA